MIAGVSPNPLVVNNLGLDFKQDLTTKVSSYGKNQAAALEEMTELKLWRLRLEKPI